MIQVINPYPLPRVGLITLYACGSQVQEDIFRDLIIMILKYVGVFISYASLNLQFYAFYY